MNQHLFVKIDQLIVANLANRLAIRCDWRLDLDGPAPRYFNYTSE